jgi:uncharacterized protein (TIGR00730 family)
MSDLSSRVGTICVYCGSSVVADPAFLQAASALGRQLAAAKIRLIYGGGGTGLMGAVAQACHQAGGKVLGIMPEFLRQPEALYEDVETIVVTSMHERKLMMFEESDAFVVLPGGVGTLEEIVELLSWRRLELHRKPIVFYNPDSFWEPLFTLLQHTVDMGLTPAAVMSTWRAPTTVDGILPAVAEMAAQDGPHIALRIKERV